MSAAPLPWEEAAQQQQQKMPWDEAKEHVSSQPQVPTEEPSLLDKASAPTDPGAEEFDVKHPILGKPVRFLSSLGGSVIGAIPSAIHAFADEPTEQEKKQYGEDQVTGVKRIGLGLGRLMGGNSIPEAVEAYKNPATRPSLSGAVSVLPEALGQGAFAAGTGELLAHGPGVIRDMIPSETRAGKTFNRVMTRAGNIPVNVAAPGDVALETQRLAESGGSQPKVTRDFIKRTTDPNKPPLTYREARDFYSNASRLSADETNRLTPRMKRQVGQFTKSLGEANRGAAEQAGVASDYDQAMKEYRRARQLRDFADKTKEIAGHEATRGVMRGLGYGGGAYAAYRLLHNR